MSNFRECQYGYVDTDSVKQALNAKYGKGAQMRNEFIVLHTAGEPIIVRKSAISYVTKEHESGKACVVVYSNYNYVDEQYNEVVRRLFK